MTLSNGLLNLTSWLGNVIMPTLAGLFAAASVYQFSKRPHFVSRSFGICSLPILFPISALSCRTLARHG